MKRNGRMDGGGTIISGVVLTVGAVAVGSAMGTPAGWGVFVGGALVGSFTFMLTAARNLSKLGFVRRPGGGVSPASWSSRRKEHAIEHSRRSSLVERLLRGVAIVSWVATRNAIALTVLAVRDADTSAFKMFMIAEFSLPTAILTTVGRFTLLQRRRDVDSEVWMWLWLSRVGKSVFAIARRLLGKKALRPAMTHRATELCWAWRPEQLYEYRGAARQALGDLPAVLRRLQDDAQRLRRRPINSMKPWLRAAPPSRARMAT
ncbi:MAG: hypothetical protein U0163_10650 [Gemmatimonadaceae bacterium]